MPSEDSLSAVLHVIKEAVVNVTIINSSQKLMLPNNTYLTILTAFRVQYSDNSLTIVQNVPTL